MRVLERLLGKKPLYAICVLAVFSFLSLLIPPLLAFRQNQLPSFARDEVKSQDFLPPYKASESLSHNKSNEFTVYGKYFTVSFEDTNSTQISTPKKTELHSIIESSDDQVINLPDGKQISLLGMCIFPRHVNHDLAGSIELEKVYYHPDGSGMTRDEAKDLHNSISRFSLNADYFAVEEIISDNLQCFFSSDLEKGQIEWIKIIDSVTGANVQVNGFAGGKNSDESNIAYLRHYDKSGLPIIAKFHTINYINPNQLSIHMKIWNQRWTRLEPKTPMKFSINGKEKRLLQINQFEKDTGERTIISGDINYKVGNTSFSGKNEIISFHFDQDIQNARSVRLIDQEGNYHYRFNSSLDSFYFEILFENIKFVEVEENQTYTYIVHKLPPLPKTMAANKNKEDILEYVLPSTILINDADAKSIISDVLQVEYNIRSLRRVAPPTYPVDMTGKTVRELVEWHLAQYEDHDVVMIKSSNGTKMELHPPGQVLINHGPLWSHLMVWLPRLIVYTNSLLLILLVVKGFFLIIAINCSKNLKRLGFPEMSIWKAEEYFLHLGSNITKLPQFEHLATIPGVDADDPKSIAKFLQQNKREVS